MDKQLRLQVLRAVCRDSAFLKAAGRDIDPDTFPEIEEKIIARAAVGFYDQYHHAIGGMLTSYAEDALEKQKLSSSAKKNLTSLIQQIQTGQIETVSVKALEDRVKKLKHDRFYNDAVETIITAYEKGSLDSQILAEVIEKASLQLHTNGFVARDYAESLQQRIDRRLKVKETMKFPSFMIDQLDRRVKGLARGQLGIWLAPPAGGKGLALVHTGRALALQGYNVMHLSLEDPADLVEDRYDASFTRLLLNKLPDIPIKLRKKFREKKDALHGRIRVIDGTDEGWTVTAIERAWERLHVEGFTADAIIVDYDDEIVCEKQFKGESARRFEFAEIYKRMRRAAARLDVIWWSAAQTSKAADNAKIITGKHVAEDYSKIRKVFLAIGIGMDDKDPKMRYLHVLKHRMDKSRFTVRIWSNYDRAMFYDSEETAKRLLADVKEKQ